jgi:cytochrome c556
MQKLAVACAVAALLLIAGCGREPAPSPQTNNDEAASAIKPLATARQIMLGITVPASDVVFIAAGETPSDDASWEKVEASALAVAESGNLLLMKPRAVDADDWRQYAQALIEAGARAAEAARAKDTDRISTAGDDMYNVCEQCHAKYLPKT